MVGFETGSTRLFINGLVDLADFNFLHIAAIIADQELIVVMLMIAFVITMTRHISVQAFNTMNKPRFL